MSSVSQVKEVVTVYFMVYQALFILPSIGKGEGKLRRISLLSLGKFNAFVGDTIVGKLLSEVTKEDIIAH